MTVYDHQVNGQLANWDAHADVFPRHKDDLLPPADRAFAALIDDLTDRGLLDSTLVIALGEFGRTPKINAQAGRDHWPYCYSAVLAGGGVRGGTVYGASDKIGAYPDRDGVSPGDLAATLLWRFGLDPTTEVLDLSGRPYRLAEGEPLCALFGVYTRSFGCDSGKPCPWGLMRSGFGRRGDRWHFGFIQRELDIYRSLDRNFSELPKCPRR